MAGDTLLNVTLVDGDVICSTPSDTMTVAAGANDGGWHNVTIQQRGDVMECDVDGESMSGAAISLPHGWWFTVQLGSDQQQGFYGCISMLLLNGERLSVNSYSALYDVSSSGELSDGCPDARKPSKAKDDKTVIIVICTFFGVTLLAIAILAVFIRRRRLLLVKQALPNAVNAFSKMSGGQPDKSLTTNDSGRSKPDSGYDGERNEEAIIQQHIEEELNKRNFNEREVRRSGNSLNMSRPDIIDQDLLSQRLPAAHLHSEALGGVENAAYVEEPPEHYDLDNASSIAPSDVFDIAAHYKQYRKNPAQHKYRQHSSHLHAVPRISPSSMQAARERHSPASVSLPRQSPALMLDRDSNGMIITHNNAAKSQLTVENVNQLNRQTPVNQLSRASPSPNITAMRAGQTSLRSTPLSGIVALYPSNISSGSFSDRQSVPNGHLRGAARPSSKLKQQGAMRGTPTKGLTIEEVNRLNARHQSPISALDVISSSSEDLGKNNINCTDFTHSDLLEPAAAHAPESSSEDETNDSFTCSEFESDHEKKRNDTHSSARPFRKLAAVNEHDDTDTTLASYSAAQQRHDTDSNRESTLFTASEDELPRRPASSRLPNVALSLDYMLNWGPNYGKLVGVFDDIAMLPQPDLVPKRPARPSSSGSNRPSSRHSQQQSPRYASKDRLASPIQQNLSSPRHSPSPHQAPAVPASMPPLHIKQPSLISMASSHDRQSSLSSLHSSRSARSAKQLAMSPLANGLNLAHNGVGGASLHHNGVGVASLHHNGVGGASLHHNGVGGASLHHNGVGGASLQHVNHSRSSSKSSVTSSRPSYNSAYSSTATPNNLSPPHREEYV